MGSLAKRPTLFGTCLGVSFLPKINELRQLSGQLIV